MLKSTADPWFCISCNSNILPFCNRHGRAKETITTPTNLFHHNELFQLIKNFNNLTDESSNDGTNSLNVSNNYRDPEYCIVLKIFARKGGGCLEMGGGLPYYIEVFLKISHDVA